VQAFTIGISALNANQRALDIIGQNIANANTPGYSRQVPRFIPKVEAGEVMAGSEINYVQRMRDNLVENAYTNFQYQAGTVTAQIGPLQQIETLFTPGNSSFDTQLNQFFNQVEQLTAQPDNLAQRGVVVGDLSNLTQQLNTIASNLDQLHVGVGQRLQDAVNQVNQLTPQIASLNEQIEKIELQGQQPNDLLDQRDELINQLASYVDVRVTDQPYGVRNVIGAGTPLIVSNQASLLQFSLNSSGNAIITPQGSSAPLTVASGQIAGMLQLYNQTIPNFRTRLDNLAKGLIQTLDGIQATGLGTSGPLTFLAGSRPVSDPTIPLATASPAFPLQSGTLYVSLTNQATGQRTLTPVAINPATQSLNQIAANITAATGGQLQATVNTTNNTLQFQAQSGYTFDFAGRPPTMPTYNGFAGTTVPQLGGAYTGASNDSYRFQVIGSGTVGMTPGLTVQVFDSANNLVNTLNVGQGYTPGTPLNVANGVTLQLSAGTFTAGSFTYPVISQPDTSGLLTATGVNTLFTGTGALDIAVNPAILANPALFAASRTGQPGDTTNLQRLANTRDQATLNGGTQTFLQFYSAMVGDIGAQVQTVGQQQSAQTALGNQLQTQRQSVSGVDPNEELVNLVQFQRAFQMAANYLAVVNKSLDELFTIIQ
jgi:flagellar hook-associated protein 1 FlgK